MGALRSKGRSADQHAEVDTEGSWAISYGDMITLLLSFFILFFSTDAQKDRMVQMEEALILKLKSAAEPKDTSLIDDSKPSESEASDRAPSSTAATSAANSGRTEQPLTSPNILNAKIHKIAGKVIIEFPNVSFFGLGKVDLSEEGRKELKSFVDAYLPFAGNYVVGIRAYTDNKKVIPYKNRRFRDNLELSALRSVAAMRVLQAYGLPLHRMKLGGYGELNLTAEDLSRAIASEPDYAKDGLRFARKIVLVVEPELKEAL